MSCGFIAAVNHRCHPEPAGGGAPAAAKDLLLRGRSFVLRVPAWQAAEHEGLAGKSGTLHVAYRSFRAARASPSRRRQDDLFEFRDGRMLVEET